MHSSLEWHMLLQAAVSCCMTGVVECERSSCIIPQSPPHTHTQNTSATLVSIFIETRCGSCCCACSYFTSTLHERYWLSEIVSRTRLSLLLMQFLLPPTLAAAVWCEYIDFEFMEIYATLFVWTSHPMNNEHCWNQFKQLFCYSTIEDN